jgi:hypothetical protein
MREVITPSNQYDDLVGRFAIDKADRSTGGIASDLLPSLAKRVEMPRGYYPVGFDVYIDRDAKSMVPYCSLTVYAIDAQCAVTGDELADYVKERDDVPVFRFAAEIKPDELAELLLKGIKRFRLVGATRLLDGKPMIQLQDG